MKRSPLLLRRYPPSPLQPSVMRQPALYMPAMGGVEVRVSCVGGEGELYEGEGELCVEWVSCVNVGEFCEDEGELCVEVWVSYVWRCG